MCLVSSIAIWLNKMTLSLCSENHSNMHTAGNLLGSIVQSTSSWFPHIVKKIQQGSEIEIYSEQWENENKSMQETQCYNNTTYLCNEISTSKYVYTCLNNYIFDKCVYMFE